MKNSFVFHSPNLNTPLEPVHSGTEVFLVDEAGTRYAFVDDIPDLTYPRTLKEKEQQVFTFYENRADVYDKFLYQTFKTHNENELETRNTFIDKLHLKTDSRVLEVACGTGRDSELIAKRLGKDAQFVMQDISPSMLKICRNKLEEYEAEKIFCISNAAYLPFPNKYFDCCYSFGGLGEFPDIKRSLAEMVRVTKVGGKIVVGDESMPPWLLNTYFSKVLSKTNPQFLAEVPLKSLPVEARKVKLEWVIGGVFYLIEFEVGEGEPTANFDYEIEGPRGGTLRTRYEGELEGVTQEAKQLAMRVCKEKGISLHKWLDSVVKEAAERDLT